MPLKIYDESIGVLRRSLDAAKVGNTDKLEDMKRLHRFAAAVEKRYAPEADFDAVIQTEEAISRSIGGPNAFDDARERRTKTTRQPGLFDGYSR